MEDLDYEYYVLPFLLAILVLGVFFVLVTSGGGGDVPPRSQNTSLQDTPSQPSSTKTKTVIVRDGDTPTSIAAGAGITLQRLLELNPQFDGTPLRPGQRFKLSR